MLVPNKHGTSRDYRFGFQGQEMDNELKGDGNSLNYEFRMHDPRVGRFFATDPLTYKYPELTPYQFGGNRVIDRVELEGLESASDDQMMLRWQQEHVKTGRMTSEQVTAIQRGQTIGAILSVTGIIDIFATKGWLSRTVMGAGLLEAMNESERGYEAQAKGNYGEAHRRFRNAGEASKLAILGLVADGVGFTIGKVAQTIKLTKNLDGFKFAQTAINKGEVFSDEGVIALSGKAGTDIKVVDDLVDALNSGNITPKDIPLDYIVRNGEKVILNTRTSTALNRAGIPMDKWYGVNQTGKTAYIKPNGEGVTFDQLGENQIKNNYKKGEALSSKPLD